MSDERPSSDRDPAGPPPPGGAGLLRSWFWLLLILFTALFVLPELLGRGTGNALAYSAFKDHLVAGEVRDLSISPTRIEGLLVLPLEDGETAPEEAAPGTLFHTVRVEDPDLIEELARHGVVYTGVKDPGSGWTFLIWMLPTAVLVGFLWMMMRSMGRAGTGLAGFGRSRARLVPEKGTGVTFDDVAGCDEAKQELSGMVEFLKNPGRFTKLGARIPKGVLLLGPPGTGKTLLARAMAGEAGVAFLSITGSDFVEMFVGVGAARVRDLFAQAQSQAPCIVFIDEIDAVGRQRGMAMGVVNDEREQTLNQLLSEMDGFEENAGVILLAATNRPEILDRALLRPGRFDRQVVLDSPDRRGREAILGVHVRDKPLAADVDLAALAATTPGMSGADLANAVNEAALLAAQEGRDRIRQHDLEEAIERVVAGPEKRSRRLSTEERRRVAFHESGHALVAFWSEHADPVKKISIVPRGVAALGYTLQLPEEEQYLKTRVELRERLRVLLAGRASEELVLGDVSTGAQDDLRVATALARQMVALFGMSERVGLPQSARSTEGRFLQGEGNLLRDCSEETAREIDEEVRRLLDEAFAEASEILERRRPALEAVAAHLIECETLEREEFEALAEAEPLRTRRA